MLQAIIEQNSSIFIENVARMLCWGFADKDRSNVDWRATAEAEVVRAKMEVTKNGCSIVSEEDLFMMTRYRALDRKVKLT